MLLMLIAKQDIAILLINKAVKGGLLEEYLLRGWGLILFLLDDEMVDVFAVIGEEEVLTWRVIDDGVIQWFVVDFVGEVESYPIVVHIFEKSENVPITTHHKLWAALFYDLSQSHNIASDVDLQRIISNFGSQEYLSIYLMDIVDFKSLIIVLTQRSGIQWQIALVVIIDGQLILNFDLADIVAQVDQLHEILDLYLFDTFNSSATYLDQDIIILLIHLAEVER